MEIIERLTQEHPYVFITPKNRKLFEKEVEQLYAVFATNSESHIFPDVFWSFYHSLQNVFLRQCLETDGTNPNYLFEHIRSASEHSLQLAKLRQTYNQHSEYTSRLHQDISTFLTINRYSFQLRYTRSKSSESKGTVYVNNPHYSIW